MPVFELEKKKRGRGRKQKKKSPFEKQNQFDIVEIAESVGGNETLEKP